MSNHNIDIEDPNPLCCCEYINNDGERSHLLGFFCDCEALDDSFERLIQRQPMPEGRLREIGAVLRDRLRIPWVSGARRIEPAALLPFIILPIFGVLATLGPVWTFTSFLFLPILTQILRKKVLARSHQTKFYCSFMVASFLYSYLIFVLEVHTKAELTELESLVHLILLLVTLCFMYKTRRQSSKDVTLVNDKLPFYYFCRTCQFYVDGRDHHCVWLDCCIGKRNRLWFILTLLLSSTWVIYTVNLSLASVCFPRFTVNRLIFIPSSCPDAYQDFHEGICFVTALFGVLVLALILAILFHQFRMVSKGMSYLDWKYKNSVNRNPARAIIKS